MILGLVSCRGWGDPEPQQPAARGFDWQTVAVAKAAFAVPIDYETVLLSGPQHAPCRRAPLLPPGRAYIAEEVYAGTCPDTPDGDEMPRDDGVGVYATVSSADVPENQPRRRLRTAGGATGWVSERDGLTWAAFPELDALLIVDRHADPHVADVILDSVGAADGAWQEVAAGGVVLSVPASWKVAESVACLLMVPGMASRADPTVLEDRSDDVACAAAPGGADAAPTLFLYGAKHGGPAKPPGAVRDALVGVEAFRVVDGGISHFVIPDLRTGLLAINGDHPTVERILATAFERPRADGS